MEDPHTDLAAFLKPFHERARLAEERLAKLEAGVQAKNGSSIGGSNVLLESLQELRIKLEKAKAEQLAERVKASRESQKLLADNSKLVYQMTHLRRALEAADRKLSKVDSPC